jgi:hypothetical protein
MRFLLLLFNRETSYSLCSYRVIRRTQNNSSKIDRAVRKDSLRLRKKAMNKPPLYAVGGSDQADLTLDKAVSG